MTKFTTGALSFLAASLFSLHSATAAPFEDRSSWMIGKWVSDDGYAVIIDGEGGVFTQGQYPLSGAVGRCNNGGGNFCFYGRYDGRNFVCGYRVSFMQVGPMRFRPTQDSFIGCPDGDFNKTR